MRQRTGQHIWQKILMERKFNVMKNSIYKYLPLVGSIVASAIFCLLFAFNVNPFFSNNGGDSAIFQQLGLAILKGKAIYVDIFDHKGFILFLIQSIV